MYSYLVYTQWFMREGQLDACVPKNARMARWHLKHGSLVIEQLFIATCNIVRWRMKNASFIRCVILK